MGGPTIEGVDYAFLPQHPNIPGLAAAGKTFACRYVGAGTADKHLTPVEADELDAYGISIVANVEGAANGLLGGYDTGRNWAQRADAHARDCGMPADRPIYLSVDFDVTDIQWQNQVSHAFRGAADQLGSVGRVGIYGSIRAMQWARRDNVATWFWQTYAWSNNRWAAGNHIEQYSNGVDLAGGRVDLDRALRIDYGQWRGKGTDMFEGSDRAVEWATTNRALGILSNVPVVEFQIEGEDAPRTEANGLRAQLDRIEQAIGQPSGSINLAAVRVIVREELAKLRLTSMATQ